MNVSNVDGLILDLAVEDSYALCEVVTRLRTVSPELSASEARGLAKSAIGGLLQAGLVKLTRLELAHAAESRLEQDAARHALDDDLAWLEPKHARSHVRVVATAAGRAAHERQ